ncbi:hypothetical protein C8R45DRAFT_990940, partial [Mycena sanguinolenta]
MMRSRPSSSLRSPLLVLLLLHFFSYPHRHLRRWGLPNAILTRLRDAHPRQPRRPLRPRAAMMARGMSASLIAVLPKVPGREVREKVMGYVRGTLAPTPPSTPQVEVPPMLQPQAQVEV